MPRTIEDPEARVRAALGATEAPGRQADVPTAARAWAEGFGIVSPDVERYAEVLRRPADALIVAMRNIARDHGVQLIDEDSAVALALYVQALHPRHILEVGTGLGLLTLHLARAAPEDCTITSIEANPMRHAQAHAFLERDPHSCATELRLGDALPLLRRVPVQEEFDMVVLTDPDLPRLEVFDQVAGRVAPGGLLVVPFALRGGRVAVSEHVWNGDRVAGQQRSLNRSVATDPRFTDVVLLPVGDGLLLARRR